MAKKLKFSTGNDPHAYPPISKQAELTLFYEAEDLVDYVHVKLKLIAGDDPIGDSVSAAVDVEDGVTFSDIANTLIPKLLSAKRVNDEIKSRVKHVKYLERQIRALQTLDVAPFVNP